MNNLGAKLLQDLLQDFQQHGIEQNLQPDTIANNQGELKRLVTFLKDRPFTLQTAKEYIQQCRDNGNTTSSIRTKTKILRTFTNWLYRNKHIKENFAQELTLPRLHKKIINMLSFDVAEQIIIKGTEVDPNEKDQRIIKRMIDLRLALRFIIRVGTRVNETRGLRGCDLHLFDSSPWFTIIKAKGGNPQIMPLPMDLIEELKLRQDYDPLFTFSEENAIKHLRKGAMLLGIKGCEKITTHTLRHFFANGLLKSQTPLQEVSRLLRHSDIKITDSTYTHYNVDDLALSLNSHHSLIRHSLDKVQVLRNLERMLLTTGIREDSRFLTEIKELPNGGLSIIINPRTQQV